MKNKLLLSICMLGLIATAACGTGEKESDKKGQTNSGASISAPPVDADPLLVEPFEFTTQDNQQLSLDDLKGKWWVADFIFTNCETVCLPMTSNMVQLQEKLKAANIDAELVSFSVDPEFDTPEVLKTYAESYGADTKNWSFVTGYEFDTIKDFSVNSFKSLTEKIPNEDQVTHNISFFLVNPKGEVVNKYSGLDPNQIDVILDDIKNK